MGSNVSILDQLKLPEHNSVPLMLPTLKSPNRSTTKNQNALIPNINLMHSTQSNRKNNQNLQSVQNKKQNLQIDAKSQQNLNLAMLQKLLKDQQNASNQFQCFQQIKRKKKKRT